MASRVNVGRIQYNMPDVYEMSKDAYEGSLKGTVGRNIGRVGKALAARNAAENIAAHQASVQAKKNKESGMYAFPNYDSNLDVITEEDKTYDPFAATEDTTEVAPLFVGDEVSSNKYNSDELFPTLKALKEASNDNTENKPFSLYLE